MEQSKSKSESCSLKLSRLTIFGVDVMLLFMNECGFSLVVVSAAISLNDFGLKFSRTKEALS